MTYIIKSAKKFSSALVMIIENFHTFLSLQSDVLSLFTKTQQRSEKISEQPITKEDKHDDKQTNKRKAFI